MLGKKKILMDIITGGYNHLSQFSYPLPNHKYRCSGFIKRIFIISLLIIGSSSFASAQRNFAQEFIDLLMENRCMEVREMYQQHADELPLDDSTFYLIYKSKMEFFFNRPDSGAIYLEKLLGNANYRVPLGITFFEFYRQLMMYYFFYQKFEDGIDLCNRMIDFLKSNPFDFDNSILQNIIIDIEKQKVTLQTRAINEPLVKIERISNRKDNTIKLIKDEYIRFDAKYNGVQIETWFDTGAGHYFYIEKSLADKIGVKIVKMDQDSVQNIGGYATRAYEGMIDSIDLKSIKLYNIPVLVFLEKFSPSLSDTFDTKTRSMIERKYANNQIIMGRPTMLLIGKFEFNWEKNTLSFPDNRSRKNGNNSSNMFLGDNNLYLNLYINGLTYSGFFYTGCEDFITIKNSFCEKNKNMIELDEIIKKPLNYFTRSNNYWNVPYEQTINTKISFMGKTIQHDGIDILIVDKYPAVETLDGIVGVRFLKSITPKVIIDFDNMEIE